MLFGTLHLFHMSEVRASAVSAYEKDYPVSPTLSPNSSQPICKYQLRSQIGRALRLLGSRVPGLEAWI
jgi:hypothetical protein